MEHSLIKKQIGKKVYTLNKVINEGEHITSTEDFLLVRDNVKKIILNNSLTKNIIIKSLTSVIVTCSENLIDEYYDELILEKGSCVELINLNNTWYIISSDGLKLN